MTLRRGITTGTCAAAAAKAAATVLAGGNPLCEVKVRLPDGDDVRVPILSVGIVGWDKRSAGPPSHANGGPALRLSHPTMTTIPAVTASVRKDAGDDPDVTHGLEVRATVSWDDAADVRFLAGEGVGTVTKPGLQVPPGQPAINPVPRRMIAAAVREVTARGVCVEIAIPGGREIAAKTFNPRLGIEGGLSILGTTGIVRPYCTRALHDALKCALDVAAACRVMAPVLVPGNIGARAARRHFALRDEQVVEVGNEWGFVLDLLPRYAFQAVMLLGHPGKLAKLTVGHWDTHSARSSPVVEYLGRLCPEILGRPGPESLTAEGLFAALESSEREMLADATAQRVCLAVSGRIANVGHVSNVPGTLKTCPTCCDANRLPVAVLLVNMAGEQLGADGDLSPWQ